MNNKLFDPDTLNMVLTYHVGSEKAVSAVRLWYLLTGEVLSDGAAARLMRKSVVDLREAGMAICSGPEGYFLAETAEELDETCHRLFKRAMTALKQVAAMRKRSLPDLAGQLGLDIDERGKGENDESI